MHEYPITCEIIRIAEKYAIENKASGVKKIALVLGDSSTYVGESIQMYFDEISKGTICDGAIVEITRVKPKLKCSVCGNLFVRKLFSFECDLCGGLGNPTAIGKEFYVDYIEV